VSAIRVIYTKSGEFYYRYLHRFSIISLIIGISELSFVTACSNSYTKSILITYKSSYKQVLYFGLPSVNVGLSSEISASKVLYWRRIWVQNRLRRPKKCYLGEGYVFEPQKVLFSELPSWELPGSWVN